MSPSSGSGGLNVIVGGAATDEQKRAILSIATDVQRRAVMTSGDGWSAVCLDGGAPPDVVERLLSLPGVERVVPIKAPYVLASREAFDSSRRVLINASTGVVAGGRTPLMIAVAPSANERGEDFPHRAVDAARAAGGKMLMIGSALLEAAGRDVLVLLNRAAKLRALAREAGIAVCIDVRDPRQIATARDVADVLQVDGRSMQNFTLLQELGKVDRPVLLRRGLGATVEEFLLAAEYILANGNGRVILCEAGTAVAGSGAKPRFEINAIPLLKKATHLPVLADLSAAVSVESTPAVACAAVAAGADGVVVKVNVGSWRGMEGSLDAARCREMVRRLGPVAAVVGRSVQGSGESVSASSTGSGSRDGTVVLPAAPRRSELTDATDILLQTDRTLASVIEGALGTKPRLEVLSQMRLSRPYPDWLWWLLRPQGDLLVRWTSYRIGRVALSRNLAYVDLARVDPAIVGELESESLNLGELFTKQEIDRFGFEFGTGTEAGDIDRALREGHRDASSLHPYVWRRYIAATSGRIGFLVIESLPVVTWRRLLAWGEQPEMSIGGPE